MEHLNTVSCTDEKLDTHPITVQSLPDDGTGAATWDAAAEKRLVRKMDIRIFPVMIVLFVLNFIGGSSTSSSFASILYPYTIH